MSTPLPSIRDLKPLEIGGKIARNGFNYQDHVGVRYLLMMLDDENIEEVWFETEDDIVLLINRGDKKVVELIQVKSNDLTSRWSISQLVKLEVLQKSLQRGRCKEDVVYKVVTSYDVNTDLEILKDVTTVGYRDEKMITALLKKINEACGDQILKNEKGHDARFWLHNCIWEKLPELAELIMAVDLHRLEDAISRIYSKAVLPDQKKELYQSLLKLVFDTSNSFVIQGISRNNLLAWLDEKINYITIPKKGFEKLTRKMAFAGYSETVIESAKMLKWNYTSEERDHRYVSGNAIDKLKKELAGELHKLLVKVDGGSIDEKEFRTFCFNVVSSLSIKHSIDEDIVAGCMYDMTNRCQHRFSKPLP